MESLRNWSVTLFRVMGLFLFLAGVVLWALVLGSVFGVWTVELELMVLIIWLLWFLAGGVLVLVGAGIRWSASLIFEETVAPDDAALRIAGLEAVAALSLAMAVAAATAGLFGAQMFPAGSAGWQKWLLEVGYIGAAIVMFWLWIKARHRRSQLTMGAGLVRSVQRRAQQRLEDTMGEEDENQDRSSR
jgi:hypothetical protein